MEIEKEGRMIVVKHTWMWFPETEDFTKENIGSLGLIKMSATHRSSSEKTVYISFK